MKRRICFLLGLMCTAAAAAQTNESGRFSFPRWSPFVSAGSVYNFDADLAGNGSFSVNRYYIEAGVTRLWSFDRMVALSAGYGQEDYQFSSGLDAPWGNIDSYRAQAVIRWRASEGWAVFAMPAIRSYVESGADLDDGISPSIIAGAGYRIGERLYLGPGIGVFGRIEDSPLYLPIVIVNWQVTDRLRIGNGGGFAATAGPGISLSYEVTKHWRAGITARYESLRFRLSPDNDVKDGVGEDESVYLYGLVGYEWFPGTALSLIIGGNFGGELALYDEGGRKIEEIDYDSAAVGGLVFSMRL